MTSKLILSGAGIVLPDRLLPSGSLVIEGAPVRGTIDCLIQAPEPAEPSAGRPHVTILEFKTGPARAGHTEQATLYRRAAEMLFPGARVDAHLVYPAGLDQMSPGAQS